MPSSAMGTQFTPEKQRELMETSLRNVRALVDQIEAEEAAERRSHRRAFIVLGAAIAILVAIVGYVVIRPPSGQTVTIPPSQSQSR